MFAVFVFFSAYSGLWSRISQSSLAGGRDAFVLFDAISLNEWRANIWKVLISEVLNRNVWWKLCFWHNLYFDIILISIWIFFHHITDIWLVPLDEAIKFVLLLSAPHSRRANVPLQFVRTSTGRSEIEGHRQFLNFFILAQIETFDSLI